MRSEDLGLHHSGEENHFVRELMRASQALANVFSREVGIPGSRLALVRLLAVNHPRGMGTMEIARRLGVNPAAVTRQLKAMEAEGVVVRQGDPKDARRSFATLTPDGLEAFREIHERAHRFEEWLAKSVSPEELSTAARVLGQVRQALDGLPYGGHEDDR